MRVLDSLQPFLEEFAWSLRQEIPDIPHPPRPGSPARLYSYWFSVVNLLLQTSPDPSQEAAPPILRNMSAFASQLTTVVEIPMPPIPARLSYAGLGFWMLAMASATGGDAWCAWAPQGLSYTPMEIVRHKTDRFEMECSAGHNTEYNVESSTKYLKKI